MNPWIYYTRLSALHYNTRTDDTYPQILPSSLSHYNLRHKPTFTLPPPKPHPNPFHSIHETHVMSFTEP
jgi:hypothetical protein